MRSERSMDNPDCPSHARMEGTKVLIHPWRVEAHAIAAADIEKNRIPASVDTRYIVSPNTAVRPLHASPDLDDYLCGIKKVFANADRHNAIPGYGGCDDDRFGWLRSMCWSYSGRCRRQDRRRSRGPASSRQRNEERDAPPGKITP